MSTTTTSRQLSPQSNAFEPYRLYNVNPTTADRAAPRSHEQSSAQGNPHGRSLLASAPRPPTSALPWQTAPIADHDPTVLDAIRALNEHYAQKAFPPDEIDHIVERYNEHLALIQAALDLRDGWSKPQVDAGFLPLPKADEGDPSNTTVFIGGLSSPIPTDLLRVFFIPFGDIDYVKTPEGKSCGFVRYKRRSDAEHAIKKMQGFELESCRFRLSWGKNPSSHDSRPAPSSAVNPALINRLASYIDAQHAKELLCCIDVVFDGNTRMFREALEFLGSSVAPCSHRNHPDEPGRYPAQDGGWRTGSYPLPINPATTNPHLSPKTRQHLSATGDLPEPHDGDRERRERTATWPSHKPALNAGAPAFQHGQNYGRAGQARPYYNSAKDNSSLLQRHNSASSDEMYPLEIEYGPLTPSPPAAFHNDVDLPSRIANYADVVCSEANIVPPFHTTLHGQLSPGIWGTGQPGQPSMHSSYPPASQNGPQYQTQAGQGPEQHLSVSAPNNAADITSVRGTNGFSSTSGGYPRRSSDPMDDKALAPTFAAQGRFGSVGQHPFVPQATYAPGAWTGAGSGSGSAAGSATSTAATAFNPFSESAFTPIGPLGGTSISPKTGQQPQASNAASKTSTSPNTETAAAGSNGPAALARAVNRLTLQRTAGAATSTSNRSSAAPRAVPSTHAQLNAGPRAPMGPRATVRA